MRRWILRGLVASFVVAVAIQLVPYGRAHDNPPVVASPAWQDDDARRLAVHACYDCHSNETRWPWYSNVAPMSWLVQRDVDRGREALNLSRWPSGEVDEMADTVEDGEMPPRQYVLNHPEARLSAAEKRILIAELERLEDSADSSGRGRGRGGDD